MGWYEDLRDSQQHEEGPPVLQLATIEGTAPRVRTHLQRGFITASAYPTRPLILSTTDVRTPKVAQIRAHDQVELVYWAPHTLSQFRIRGRAAIVPAPGHDAVLPTDGVFGALQREGYAWEDKRTAVFDAMSARMKATWCWPAPGTPLGDASEPPEAWPKTLPKLGEARTPEEKRLLAVSLGNFVLLGVEPVEVDHLDFRAVPAKRTRYEWDERSSEFKATSLAP